ncbi:MAG: anthranilate phosphoribosyltransferase, partial [bacterium]
LIIHGEEGLDEISINGPTLVIEVRNGEITEKRLHPEDFGLSSDGNKDISGNTPAENAKLTLDLLNGNPGPARDIVLANAACAFIVSGLTETIGEGLKKATESLDSGAALKKLQDLKQLSNDI